jgi:hypothetical protein
MGFRNMKLSASIRAGRSGLPNKIYLGARGGGGKHEAWKQGKTAAIEAAYPEFKKKWPNAAYHRWIPRKNKTHKLKGLRP